MNHIQEAAGAFSSGPNKALPNREKVCLAGQLAEGETLTCRVG